MTTTQEDSALPSEAAPLRVSAIHGTGHGSAHTWRYEWTSPSRTSYYTCCVCGAKFGHHYPSVPGIFMAMKLDGISAECTARQPS